jgi:SNF2 family DNA or RNA helicase
LLTRKQDKLWSDQDDHQIKGRAYRYPQTKAVTVYYLIARDSTDDMMVDLSVQKHNMLASFLKGVSIVVALHLELTSLAQHLRTLPFIGFSGVTSLTQI